MARSKKNPKSRSCRLFLAPQATERPLGPGDEVQLEAGELEHASRVLRLPVGATVEILDGRGGRASAELIGDRRVRGVRLTTAMATAPLAGEPGSSRPHIELLMPPPRGARFETLLDRAAQLGAARLRPLICKHTGPEDRGARRDRHARVLREACKQSGNLQLPELEPLASLDEALSEAPRPLFYLEPLADLSLPKALEAQGVLPRLSVAAGPEGGFTTEERRSLTEADAIAVRLAPHILRIETAVEASLSVVVAWGLDT